MDIFTFIPDNTRYAVLSFMERSSENRATSGDVTRRCSLYSSRNCNWRSLVTLNCGKFNVNF